MDDPLESLTDDQKILAACEDDQDEWLNDLLSQGAFDVCYTDDNGNSALHYIAKNGSLACLEMLIRVPGIPIQGKNHLGNTPLHYAVQYAEDHDTALEMVNILLDAGANPRIVNRRGESPQTLVEDTNDEDMKGLLDAVLVGDLSEEEVEEIEDERIEDGMIDV
ncbi:ankyrin [Hesseltinella vesiculosa]|uniref:Ankyrin n=1 Tax=Hesseltinella vesiculosa TaxID=101127 RepID=A0A1X2GP51_9FUNG|nr:ankyrin [Hesseltinella vesiculosa]